MEFTEHSQNNTVLSAQIRKTGISGKIVEPAFHGWLVDANKLGL